MSIEYKFDIKGYLLSNKRKKGKKAAKKRVSGDVSGAMVDQTRLQTLFLNRMAHYAMLLT